MKTFNFFEKLWEHSRTLKRVGLVLVMCLITIPQAWASDPHFHLTGPTPTGSWSNSATEWKLSSPASSALSDGTKWDEYCTYMWLSKDDQFGLNNGSKRYSRNDYYDIEIKEGSGSGIYGYPADAGHPDKCFNYRGATGLVRINAAQSGSGDSYGNQGQWYPYIWVEESLETDILNGSKIMFYFGIANSWNTNWFFLSKEGDQNANKAYKQYYSMSTRCETRIAVAYVDANTTYYIASAQSGGTCIKMASNAEAGNLYSLNSQGGNNIYVNVGNKPHFATTSVTKAKGTEASTIAATAANSIFGNAYTYHYYYTTDGGSTFTKFNPADISGLASGTYTVYALGWDGHILVKSDNSVTLKITVPITLNANGGVDGAVTSVNAVNGDAASGGNIAGGSLPTKTNYVFTGFYTSGGTKVINADGEWISNVSGYTDASGNWTCTAGSTLYAHWEDQWNLKGSWDEWGTYKGMPYVSSNTYRVTLELSAGTYDFKVVKRTRGSSDVYYGKASTTFTRSTITSAKGLVTTAGEMYDMHITTDIAGDYVFTYVYDADNDNMKVYVKYPCFTDPAGGTIFYLNMESSLKPGSQVRPPRQGTVELLPYASISGGVAYAGNKASGGDHGGVTTSGEVYLDDNDAYIKIQLDCALETGDKITVSTNNDVYVTTSSTRATTYNISKSATYVCPAAFNNATEIYLWRNSSNAKVTAINIERCSNPTAPTAFSTSNVMATTATFSITDAADAESYDLYYASGSPSAPTSETTATENVTTKTPTITGLSASTTYKIWVRSVCDANHKSSWYALSGNTFKTADFEITDGGKNTSGTPKWSDKSNGDAIVNTDIDGIISGGTVVYTGTGTLSGNDTHGIIFDNDNDELTITVTGMVLPVGAVITIVQHGNSSTSKATGFKISGNSMSPETCNNGSATYKEMTQTYTVVADDGVAGKNNFKIKWTGTNQVYLKSMKVTGCVTASTYYITNGSPSNGTIAITSDGSSAITEAEEDATVYIEATPADGYSFTSWDVYKTGATATKVSTTDATASTTFTMPDYAVTVDATFSCTTPTIGTNPSDATVCKDATKPELSVTASANGGTLSYQWYSNTTKSTSDATLLTDSTKAKMYAPTGTAGTKYYYCVVTNTTGGCSATSDIATVTVKGAATITWGTQPADGTVGDDDFAYAVSCSDGSTVTVTSNNTSYGTIVDGKLHYVAAGTTYLIATATDACGNKIVQNSNNFTVSAALSSEKKLLGLKFSNGFDAFIDETYHTVTAYYLYGTSAPTVSSHTESDDATYSKDGNTITITAEDGTTQDYTLTLSTVTPYAGTGSEETFTGSEAYIKGGIWEDSEWNIRKNSNDDDRQQKGLNRLYFFIDECSTITLTSSCGNSRNIYVYRNGTKLDSPTSIGTSGATIEIAGSASPALYAILPNGTNGDIEMNKIMITPNCTSPGVLSVVPNTGSNGAADYQYGDELTLTASCADGTDASTTYAWYKGADWSTAKAAGAIQSAKTAAAGGTTYTKSAELSDAGTYWCEASNGSGCETHNLFGEVIFVGKAAFTPDLEYESLPIPVGSTRDPVLTDVPDGAGAATYTSSDTDVAEVDSETGVVTAKAVGNATIRVDIAESANYIARYDTKLISVREAVLYTVTFDPNGGEIDDSTDPVVMTQATEGEALTMPTPEHATYTFDGWYIADTEIGDEGAYTPTKDVTAYAKWIQECSGGGSTPVVLFSQNFNSAAEVAYEKNRDVAYDKTTNTLSNLVGNGDNLFTSITAGGASDAGLAINSETGKGINATGIFQAYKKNSSDAYWSIVRTNNFAITAPTALKVEMDVWYDAIGSGSYAGVNFAIGDGFEDGLKTSSPQLSSNVHSGFGITNESTPKLCAYNTYGTKIYNTGWTESTWMSIVWVINNTGDALTYDDPDGSGSTTLNNDCYDIWLKTQEGAINTFTLVSHNIAATTASKTLQNIHIGSNSGQTNEFRLDNIVVTDLAPSGSSSDCYRVNYHSNGADGGLTFDPMAYDEGDLATVVANGFTFEHETEFIGWNTAVDGSGTMYRAGDKLEIPDDDVDLYAQWMPINRFQATEDWLWNNEDNWSHGVLPSASHMVIIEKPCELRSKYGVNPIAKVKTVVIDKYGDNTGRLTIGGPAGLAVEEMIKTKNADGDLVGTSTTDLNIESSSDHENGALAVKGYTEAGGVDLKATVTPKTKARVYGWSVEGEYIGFYVNQFIGTPMLDAKGSDYYGSWLYRWDATAPEEGPDAGKGDWVYASGALAPFQGYTLLFDNHDETYLWLRGTLVYSDSKVFNLAYDARHENLAGTETMLANSYLAPIDVTTMTTTDFAGGDEDKMEATIYVFNSGTPNNWSDNEKEGKGNIGELPGQFLCMSINSAVYTGGITEISSMQAFSVYAKSTGATFNLDYERMVYNPLKNRVTGIAPMRAPSNKAAANDNAPDVMKIMVECEHGADKLFMLTREDFNAGFDNGWDARKMFGETFAPQLYAFTPDGNMSVNCVPDEEGAVLGFRKGSADDVYTISFTYNGEKMLYLNDTKEQLSTLISDDAEYTFVSETGDTEARFIISETPYNAPAVTTGFDGINAEQKAKVHKVLINDHIYIIRGGRMYDATGKMLK